MIKNSHLPLMLLIFAGIFMPSCKCTKKSVTTIDPQTQQTLESPVIGVASPSLLVYKTVKDYNHFVPVILTDDKTQISSYPDIKDIYYRGELAYPTVVEDGYLIDNRGIGIDVAFLDLTYEAYSQFEETPSADVLYSSILDKDPLLELYDLGPRIKYKNLVEEVNKIIIDGELNKYKRLK